MPPLWSRGSCLLYTSYRPYLQSSLFLKLRSPVTGDFALNEFWAEQETELSPDFYRLAGWGAIDPTLTSVMPKIAKGEVTVEQGMQEIQQIALADFDRAKCKI